MGSQFQKAEKSKTEGNKKVRASPCALMWQ